MPTSKIGRTSEKAFNILRTASLSYSQIKNFGDITTDYKILAANGDYSSDVKSAILESICANLNFSTGDLWVNFPDYLTAHKIISESNELWHSARIVRCQDGLQLSIDFVSYGDAIDTKMKRKVQIIVSACCRTLYNGDLQDKFLSSVIISGKSFSAEIGSKIFKIIPLVKRIVDKLLPEASAEQARMLRHLDNAEQQAFQVKKNLTTAAKHFCETALVSAADSKNLSVSLSGVNSHGVEISSNRTANKFAVKIYDLSFTQLEMLAYCLKNQI
jgi:hypothetical protein